MTFLIRADVKSSANHLNITQNPLCFLKQSEIGLRMPYSLLYSVQFSSRRWCGWLIGTATWSSTQLLNTVPRSTWFSFTKQRSFSICPYVSSWTLSKVSLALPPSLLIWLLTLWLQDSLTSSIEHLVDITGGFYNQALLCQLIFWTATIDLCVINMRAYGIVEAPWFSSERN